MNQKQVAATFEKTFNFVHKRLDQKLLDLSAL